MTQEALRNIDRHARATRVAVTLEIVSGTHLVLRIDDDGVGFDPQTPRLGHYGLIGLHEQAELIGADLRIDQSGYRWEPRSASRYPYHPLCSRRLR